MKGKEMTTKKLFLITSNYTPTLVWAEEINEGTLEELVVKAKDQFWTKDYNDLEQEEIDELFEDELWVYIDGFDFTGFVQIDSVHEIPHDREDEVLDTYNSVVSV